MFHSPLCRLLLAVSLALACATFADAQQASPPLGSSERPLPQPSVTAPVPPSPPVVKTPVAPTVKSLDKKPDEKKSDPPK